VAVTVDLDVVAAPAEAPAPSRAAIRARRTWDATWPKILAIAIVILGWQIVVWSGWKDEFLIPSPFTVFDHLWQDRGDMAASGWVTLGRGIQGFIVAVIIGGILGIAVARVPVLCAAIGSMITGLQTMPSIAWFPASIVVFGLNESAILFVVVLGAAPSIANGLISGVDNIPPVLLRAGRVLGARGLSSVRHVVMPAALPSFVGGLKQGWAFAWRSLLAGELLATALGKDSVGVLLENNRQFSDYEGLIAVMIVILVIGIIVDGLFGALDKQIRRRYGLIDVAAE